MQNQKVLQVINSFEQLLTAASNLGTEIKNAKLPFIMPAAERIKTNVQLGNLVARSLYSEPIDSDSRKAAATGLVCANYSMLNAVELLNTRKLEFKQSMLKLRQEIPNLSALAKTLPPDTKAQLKNYGILTEIIDSKGTRANLAVCYTPIRVLPKQLISFKWTWARCHTKITTLSRSEVQDYAREFPVPRIAKKLLKILSSIHDEKFALVINKQPQLRANIQYQHHDEIIKKAISVSGLCIVQEPELPAYLWRDLDLSTSKPIINRSRTIEQAELVEGSYLHRFLGK